MLGYRRQAASFHREAGLRPFPKIDFLVFSKMLGSFVLFLNFFAGAMAFGEPNRTARVCERLLLAITMRPRYRA
jgi:hypothetical protein